MAYWEQFNGFLQAFWFLYNSLMPFFNHLNVHHRYVQELTIETDKLRESIGTIKARICDDGQGKHCGTEVKEWLHRAVAAEKDVENIISKYESSKRLLKWWVLGHHERHKFRKLAKKKLKEIRELTEHTRLDDGFRFAIPGSDNHTIIDMLTPIPDKREEAVSEVVTAIVECLKDGEDSMIGVYGGEEIGNIDFAQKIRSRIQGFDRVFCIKVNRVPDVVGIQRIMATEMGLSLSGDLSDDEIAGCMSVWLERKKCLIVLEDVWSHLDLKKLGVVKPTNKLGTRIVVVTPLEEVCKEMEIASRFKVDLGSNIDT